MYLTEPQVNDILNSPFFREPSTETIVRYGLYRGHLNVIVYTYRFNLVNETFNANAIRTHLTQSLMSQFTAGTRLLTSIDYDFLLTNEETNSFYIWRSNSNAVHFDSNNETTILLTHDNIYRLVENATRINLALLNLNFESSAVKISKVLALVFSFIKLV